jgi:RNA polymerase sigma factor (sigma-70 family)
MNESDQLAESFEQNRPHLRAVAYRMLGSLAEAEDAVQETWLRASRAHVDDIDSVGAWLTTIVGRVCLNVLRARKSRREELVGVHMPDPVVARFDLASPEDDALLADSVGLALQVVLETLTPAERLAFVLHDMFDLPFDEIASMMGRTPASARQLASRARRRVRGADAPDPDVARQREVVDAFFDAAHRGDFEALVAALHPDVVLRADGGTARPEVTMVVRGAENVASRAVLFHQPSTVVHPALVNGAAGVVVTVDGTATAVIGLNVSGGKIVELNVMGDPDRLARLDLSDLGLSA